MKILIATGVYAPEIGGPATYTAMLEEDLPASGFEITVLPFMRVRRYPKLIRHIIYFWLVWRAAKQADVVYALDAVSVGVPAWLAALLRSRTFIVRLGGDYAWEQGRVRFSVTQTLDEYSADPKSAPLSVRTLAKVQSFVVQQAVRVIAPSEYLQRIIMSWGISAEKISVINSALHPLEPSVKKAAAVSAFEPAHPVVVTAGRLVPWKGMRVVIDAIRALTKTYPNILLVICGDGPQRDVLEAQVQKHNLSKHVLFAGQVPKTQLADIVYGADVFVLNTAYEGLSHQLLEVMDLGVPIVTTAVGGNGELLTDEVDALLVEFNNKEHIETAISTIVGHPETAQRITRFARVRSKDFERTKVVAELVAVLQSL